MAIQSAIEIVKAAKQEIENLTAKEVTEELKNENVVLIDISEPNELIKGSINAPRGLKFYANPSLLYHKKKFDTEKRIILHCALGGRSA